MSRTTLAVVTVIGGTALALTAGAGAATHPRWTIADLGTFGARWTSGSAAAVNEHGQVVGTNGTAAGKQHAFVWQHGKMRDLGTLGGRDSGASAINESGQVVGYSYIAGNAAYRGFIWDAAGGMIPLPTLGGTSSYAYGLNNLGQVVGDAQVAGNSRKKAFVWDQTGGMVSLGCVNGEL